MIKNKTKKSVKNTKILLASVGATSLLLTGCATAPNPDPRDPFEPYNRSVTKFNDKVDRVVLKPVAQAYRNVTPAPARTGISNFFTNLTEPWSLVNNLLQFKLQAAGESWVRFSVNTFLGFGGLLDLAGAMNIERHNQNFGKTLAYWGVPSGPYLILPILGPSTVRDGLSLVTMEWRGDPIHHIDDVPTRNSMYALGAVNLRANFLRAESVLDEAALDKYSFTRDVFLQLRQNQTHKGRLSKEDGQEGRDDIDYNAPEEPAN